MNWFLSNKNGFVVNIHAVPGSKEESVSGLHGNALKIKIKAQATDGKANKALIAFIAKTLQTSPRNIELLSGAANRQKRLLIRNVNKEKLLSIL